MTLVSLRSFECDSLSANVWTFETFVEPRTFAAVARARAVTPDQSTVYAVHAERLELTAGEQPPPRSSLEVRCLRVDAFPFTQRSGLSTVFT